VRVPVREYEYGDTGVMPIGLVGVNGRGLSGVEYTFDKELRANHELDGATVQLALDIKTQARVERQLADFAGSADATGVSAIVLDPMSGEVHAAAQWPASRRDDVRSRGATDADPRMAVDVFEAGPLIAPLLLSRDGGAAESVLVGSAPKEAGERLARRRGIDWTTATLRQFGLGAKPHSGLSAETAGWIANEMDRRAARFAERLGRGETTAASLLQTAAAFALLVNGQEYLQPHFVLRMCDSWEPSPCTTSPRGDWLRRRPPAPDPAIEHWAQVDRRAGQDDVLFLRTSRLRTFGSSPSTSVSVGAARCDGHTRLLALQVDGAARKTSQGTLSTLTARLLRDVCR
jgi:hypothetical protein